MKSTAEGHIPWGSIVLVISALVALVLVMGFLAPRPNQGGPVRIGPHQEPLVSPREPSEREWTIPDSGAPYQGIQ